ncbi:MAG: class A beta-lactamase-related serine hydrolase [Myxococcales bacterium]|nr:class A beta-lactamase-related serine hydrolase [Myxococcales bacterium]
MLSRRRFISCGAGSLAQVWSPSLLAAPVVHIIYDLSKKLEDALEYREVLIELLPDEICSSLQVAKMAQQDYALVVEVGGIDALQRARDLAHTHDLLLLEVCGVSAYFKPIVLEHSPPTPTYHLSYGRYTDEDEASRALLDTLNKIGEKYRAKLLVERAQNDELELILQLYASRDAASQLAKQHSLLISSSVQIIRDKIRLTELSATSLQMKKIISSPSGLEVMHNSAELRAPPSPNVTVASATRDMGNLGTGKRSHPQLRPFVRTRLRNQLNLYIQRLRKRSEVDRDEHTSWYVYTLHDDQTWVSINGDASRQTASMIKPFIGLAYFDRAFANNWTYSIKVQQQLQRMITYSSNSATNWILDRLGGPRVAHRLLRRKYGHIFKETRIVEKIPTNGRTYRNRASAMDYVRFCRALWHREVPGASQILRDMGLSRTDRIVKHADNIPDHTYLMNKTGSTARLVGDFGIVMAQTRKGGQVPYVMVAVIEKDERIEGTQAYRSWKNARSKVIGQASDVVYLHLKDRYNLV